MAAGVLELAPSSITASGEANLGLSTVSTAGSRLQLNALETPASVSVLSGEDIRGREYNEGQQWIRGEPRSVYLTADVSF